jgi:hypothetical protein
VKPAVVAISALLTVCACAFVTISPRPEPKLEPGGSYTVRVPAKVHMLDGSVVVYNSLRMDHDTLYGHGVRYDLLRKDSVGVETVPLESVVGVEHYDKHSNLGTGLAATPIILAGGVFLFKAIFGSCPTIYTFDGAGYTLEAEAFSYSIARAMEGRDLDRLDLGRPVDGEYRLMVTNEALETHYINSLSLTTVDHPVGCEALPSDNGGIILFGRPNPLARATSRDGRDVSRLLASRDSGWYETDTALVRRLADTLVRDWIDIAVPVPTNARTACLAFKFRNTLLNTVWLYDVALKQQGLGALDWLAMDRMDIFSALRLRHWYSRNFGLHIQSPSGRGFREIARIRDTGPIAWHQVAVQLPLKDRDTLRLRLDFLPDNWTIDWVGVSFENPGNPETRTVYCDRVEAGDGTVVSGASELFKADDRRYFITGPSDCYHLFFKPEPVPAGSERDWFVRTGGYYIEWLRRDWLGTEPAVRFKPDDHSITQAAALWLDKKPDMERLFLETKLPVRRSR